MNFELFQQEDIWRRCSEREGEQKIGQHLLAGSDFLEKGLSHCPAQFVIMGISEDAGPRANCGRGGAYSAWNAFLNKFINIQESDRIKGSNLLLLGNLDFSTLANYNSRDVKKLRKLVENIDEEVSEITEKIIAAGKIPIVIGGGHNNAYPLLKGASKALQQAVNCVNLDPHADYRPLEGRHSGNGFSYAKAEGYLNQYSIIGLHENYNAQTMLNRMEEDGVDYSTYEAIFLRKEINFETAINKGLNHVEKAPFGVELDCDAIENFPSSAQTPSGISSLQARQYLHEAGKNKQAVYLHLPEAAPVLVHNSEEQVGKLLSYLVSDFIKAKSL